MAIFFGGGGGVGVGVRIRDLSLRQGLGNAMQA